MCNSYTLFSIIPCPELISFIFARKTSIYGRVCLKSSKSGRSCHEGNVPCHLLCADHCQRRFTLSFFGRNFCVSFCKRKGGRNSSLEWFHRLFCFYNKTCLCFCKHQCEHPHENYKLSHFVISSHLRLRVDTVLRLQSCVWKYRRPLTHDLQQSVVICA